MKTLLFIILIGDLIEPALASALSEREMLVRCYGHLTGQRIPTGHALWTQISAGKRAVRICLDLLNETKLAADGSMATASNDQRLILRQFNDFHRSWFAKQFMSGYDFGDSFAGMVDVHDPTEGALFLTRTLLADSQHYSSVLRGFDAMEALRDSSTANGHGSSSGIKRASRVLTGGLDNFDGTFDWNASVLVSGKTTSVDEPPFETSPLTLLQVGSLYGIRPRSSLETAPRIFTRHTGGSATMNEGSIAIPHPVRKNYGGGVLGSQPFLLFNFGYGLEYQPNGADKIPRTWMSAALKTFLCREGPYLLDSDVNGYLQGTASGVPAFRNQKSCLRCHATLDQGALTARNLVPASTLVFATTSVRATVTIANYAVNSTPQAGQEPWPVRGVAAIRNQSPMGKLYFRSITGELVHRDVNGINEMGTAMTETDDYYVCAAKRYVEYLTGVKVKLSEADGNSKKEKAWRDLTVALGRELRQTGSLKTLVKRIMESDYYRQRDFGR